MNLYIKKRIIEFREFLNLSELEISKLLGIHATNYKKFENPKFKIRPDTVDKILKVYTVTHQDFFSKRHPSQCISPETLNNFKLYKLKFDHKFIANRIVEFRNLMQSDQISFAKALKMDTAKYRNLELETTNHRCASIKRICTLLNIKEKDFYSYKKVDLILTQSEITKLRSKFIRVKDSRGRRSKG